jgi:hypothetical protein
MTTRNTFLRIAIFLLISFDSPIRGEFSSGLAGSMFSNMSQNNAVGSDNQKNNTNSREYVLNDMQNQANKGAGVAMGLGSAMIGAGIPMSLDIFDPVRMSAGLELISKGAQEIAQGASLQNNADQYGGQRSTLNTQSPEAFPSTVASQNAAKQLNNPQFDQMISDAGLNPNEFKNQLMSGAFPTGADIMQALGKPLTPEMAEKANAMADQIAGGMASQVAASDPRAGDTITAVKNSDAQGGSDSAIASLSRGENLSPEPQIAAAESQMGKATESLANNSLAKQTKTDALAEGKNSSLDVTQMFTKMFGADQTNDPSAQKMMVRQELGKIGIQLPVPGVSIFALAHRQYNEFGKARARSKRVAQR